MALRLIEMVLQEKDGDDVRTLLNECKVLEQRQIRLADGEILVRILLDAEQSETVLDLLEKNYAGREGNRVVILPVEGPVEEPDVSACSGVGSKPWFVSLILQPRRPSGRSGT